MAKKKSTRKETELIVPKRLQHEMGIYFARHSAKTTNLALRNLVMDYLINGPSADMRVEKGLNVIWNLMRLLDKAQDMLPARTINETLVLSKKGNYYPEFDNDYVEDEDEYEM